MNDSNENLEELLDDEEAGRHATNLELFFDLVFVFGVSQLARLIASDISGAGVARSALVAWIIWSLWSQFSWLGTSVDLDRDGPTRFAFLTSIFPTLFLAISIPQAYGDNAAQFGLAVLAGTAWVLGLQGLSLWGDPHTRGPFIHYASMAGISPVLIAVGGFLDETPRIVLWIIAAAIGIAGTFAANRQSSTDDESAWRINPVHFAERHGLFIIIVLGEILVAIGVAAREQALTMEVAGAVMASATLTAVLWWAYFGFISRFGEEGLKVGHGTARAKLARDFFTFGHFPLVLGLAFLASIIEHVVAHPTDHLHTDELWLLGTALVLIIGGFMGLQWRLRRKVSPERLAAIASGSLMLWLVGPHVGGTAVIALVAGLLIAMQAITSWRVAQLSSAG